MVKLIITDDEGKTTIVPLIRDEFTIGRKEGNSIRLSERNISRRHARLAKLNGALFIEDLNSYNGLKVNGNRVNGRVAITEGDRIQIGDYKLELKMDAAAVAETPDSSSAETAATLEMKIPIEDRTLPYEPATTVDTRSAEGAKEAGKDADAATRLEKFARLVCVSTNFASKEWPLDKSLMVIGRTEDNEVIINHRSISRHHARITCEDGRYTIIDLQSSNGVRVNGEEYGKVELRPGDLVDLGHVRLRFVGLGEDFIFSRDAKVVDLASGARAPLALWIGLAVAIIAIGGVVFWRVTESRRPASGTGSGQEIAIAPTSGTKAETSAALANLQRALSAEKWEEAQALCGQLNGEDKNRGEADCAKAKLEQAAQTIFAKAEAALGQNQIIEALGFFNQLPENSVIRDHASSKYAEVKEKFVNAEEKKLENAIASGECNLASKIAERIREADSQNATAESKARNCSMKVVAVKPPPTAPAVTPPPPKVAVATAKPVRKPKSPDTAAQGSDAGDTVASADKPERGGDKGEPKTASATPPADPRQVDTFMQELHSSYMAGDHARVITIGKKVLRLAPQHKTAIQIMGASYCYLKNRAQAMWAYERLPTAQRNLLKSVCERNGVTIE